MSGATAAPSFVVPAAGDGGSDVIMTIGGGDKKRLREEEDDDDALEALGAMHRAKRRRGQTAAAGGGPVCGHSHRAPAARGRVRTRTAADLVPEILSTCLAYLSAVEIVTQARRVCRAWSAYSRSNLAWATVHAGFTRLRDAASPPHPLNGLVLSRIEDELSEEEYVESLEYYRDVFDRASRSMREDMRGRLQRLPAQPREIEAWWWRDGRAITPVFRRARLMWTRLSNEPSLREVSVGADHIEEQLSQRNTFTDFQFVVGDLWVADLYISVGFLPPPVPRDERGHYGCACDVAGPDGPPCDFELHQHPTTPLLRAEVRRNPPKLLRLHSSHHAYCAGTYTLCPYSVNGYPCWAKEDDESLVVKDGDDTSSSSGWSTSVSWLYSSPLQVWTFSNREGDFENGAGHIAATTKHNGFLPQANREWMHGNGATWSLDPTIVVRSIPAASDHFLSNQNQVTPKMRGVVVSWLSEVQNWTRGPLEPHTLFLATAVFDQYLGAAAAHSVGRQSLQLVACAAVCVASTAESPLLPGDAETSIVDRVVTLSGMTYTTEQVLAMVESVRTTLGPNCARRPTTYLFLERYIEKMREYESFKPAFQHAAEFLAELANAEYKLVARYRPAVLAAGCVLVATRNLSHAPIEGTDHLRLLDPLVEQCCADVQKLALLWRPYPPAMNAIREKYLAPQRKNVAAIFDALAECEMDQFCDAHQQHPADE